MGLVPAGFIVMVWLSVTYRLRHNDGNRDGSNQTDEFITPSTNR